MKLEELMPKTHFIQFNLSDMLEELGEELVKEILSSFSCPKNKDVENFLRNKAIEFSKRGFAKTHLIFWSTDDGMEKALVGYYTIAPKFITIQRGAVNSKEARKLREQGIYNEKTNEYTVSAPLIGQLGKNFSDGNDSLILGSDLLQLAIDKVLSVQKEIGGRFVYLECEDKPELIKFYEKNHFKQFGKRKLDRDETDIDGHYLLQYFTIL